MEDNDVFREALELMLGVTPDIRVVGAVGDGTPPVAACEELRPDVVLMDYRLPGLDGVEATAAIRPSSGAAVVVLTATAEQHELDALLEAGAVACLTKDTELDEIVGAIRERSAARCACSSESTAVVLDSTADLPDPAARHPNWRLVPLYVRFGDETFRDHVDLSAADFYPRLRESQVQPKTSQPTPADFERVFAELEGFERILCIAHLRQALRHASRARASPPRRRAATGLP